MNTKEKLNFVIAALSVTFLLHYFVGNFTGRSVDGDEVVSGQKMAAPKMVKSPDLYAPLNSEIDFYDADHEKALHTTEIQTDGMKLTFSNHGAVIDAISFKDFNASDLELQTYNTQALGAQREAGAFLLAFKEETPYYYDLISQSQEQDGQTIIYQAKTPKYSITKKFKVFNNEHKIDLTLSVSAPQGEQARLFVPGPFLSDISHRDVVQGIMNIPGNKVQKDARSDSLAENYWPSPSLFGVEDRYFVHAMVKDLNNFALRGFYELEGESALTAILESYPIADDQDHTWTLSFYVGPKEASALNAVDPRLETTLDYGFFAPLSKVLLSIMNFMHGYIPNYGLLIILFTLLIKLLLIPFSSKQNQAMKKSKELQRKLAYLEQKYRNEPEVLMREKSELIRKHGMPGALGCLPLFLQIALFWALRLVLLSSIDLFHAPFLWISDLSAPDPLYILPALMAIGMALSLAGKGTIRQRLPFVLASIVVGALMANMAAGLSLFIAASTWLTVAENYFKKSFGW